MFIYLRETVLALPRTTVEKMQSKWNKISDMYTLKGHERVSLYGRYQLFCGEFSYISRR